MRKLPGLLMTRLLTRTRRRPAILNHAQLTVERLEARNPAAALIPLLDGTDLLTTDLASADLQTSSIISLSEADQTQATDQSDSYNSSESLEADLVDSALLDWQNTSSGQSTSTTGSSGGSTLESPLSRDPLAGPLGSQSTSTISYYDSYYYDATSYGTFSYLASSDSTQYSETTFSGTSSTTTGSWSTYSGSSTDDTASLTDSDLSDPAMDGGDGGLMAEGEPSGPSGSLESDMPPLIMDFAGMEGPTAWTFEGWVADEYPGGLTIKFGGILEGYTATTNSDGQFYVTLSLSTDGTATAQTTDKGGQDSDVATYDVWVTS